MCVYVYVYMYVCMYVCVCVLSILLTTPSNINPTQITGLFIYWLHNQTYGHCLVVRVKMNLNFLNINLFLQFEADFPNGGGNQNTWRKPLHNPFTYRGGKQYLG